MHGLAHICPTSQQKLVKIIDQKVFIQCCECRDRTWEAYIIKILMEETDAMGKKSMNLFQKTYK